VNLRVWKGCSTTTSCLFGKASAAPPHLTPSNTNSPYHSLYLTLTFSFPPATRLQFFQHALLSPHSRSKLSRDCSLRFFKMGFFIKQPLLVPFKVTVPRAIYNFSNFSRSYSSFKTTPQHPGHQGVANSWSPGRRGVENPQCLGHQGFVLGYFLNFKPTCLHLGHRGFTHPGVQDTGGSRIHRCPGRCGVESPQCPGHRGVVFFRICATRLWIHWLQC